MARLKISQLEETTTPVGTDVLPIVNGGVTKKVTLNTIRSGISGGSDVSGLSANWQNTYTSYRDASGSFATNTTVSNVSSQLVLNSNFNSYKTNVAEATATLTPLTTTRTLTGLLVTSSNFNSYKTNVAEATATLTPLTTTRTLTSALLPIAGGTITGNLSTVGLIQTAVSVVTSSSTYTFNDSDSNRVYHFETVSPLSAIFPDLLAQGFNVTIVNTGTGTLYLSAPSYKALSNVLLDQYSGAFVYKQGSDIFAVGGL